MLAFSGSSPRGLWREAGGEAGDARTALEDGGAAAPGTAARAQLAGGRAEAARRGRGFGSLTSAGGGVCREIVRWGSRPRPRWNEGRGPP